MTRDLLEDGSITDADEFQGIMAAALEQAIDANVDVRGAWEFQPDGDGEAWEMTIVELVKEIESEVDGDDE